MPSNPHETVVIFIASGVQHVDRVLLDCIPNSERLLSCETHTNLTIGSTSQEFIPDCIHLVDTIHPFDTYATILLEVAFNQSRASLLDRLKKSVAEYPEILMVIIGEVDESTPYQAPKPWSIASQTLGREPQIRPAS
jgi:hypothetical protein